MGDTLAAVIIVRPALCGDGTSTVEELIERLNDDPRRGDYDQGALTSLDRVEPDEAWWSGRAVHGIGPHTVLPTGARVAVYTEEAETIDVTDSLHPRWAAAAQRATELLDIDVGGVDFLVDTPIGPEGVLLEVNCLPALHLHALPTRGAAQPVFEAFVRLCLEAR